MKNGKMEKWKNGRMERVGYRGWGLYFEDFDAFEFVDDVGSHGVGKEIAFEGEEFQLRKIFQCEIEFLESVRIEGKHITFPGAEDPSRDF
jgi:hypothetical protein